MFTLGSESSVELGITCKGTVTHAHPGCDTLSGIGRLMPGLGTWLSSIVLLVSLLLRSAAAQDTHHTVLRYDVGGSSGWVPFGYTGNGQHPGVFAELVDQVFALANIPIEKKYFPPKRSQQLMNEGYLDFDFTSPVWFPGGNVGDGFVTSEPLFDVTEYFVTLPENAERYQSPEAIYGNWVGTVAGYYYYDDDKYKRADFLSESELILGLKMQRFDVAIMEKHAADYWSSVHEVDVEYSAVHTSGGIVMRFHNKHADLLPQINQAIASLQAQGEIQRLVNKYINRFAID